MSRVFIDFSITRESQEKEFKKLLNKSVYKVCNNYKNQFSFWLTHLFRLQFIWSNKLKNFDILGNGNAGGKKASSHSAKLVKLKQVIVIMQTDGKITSPSDCEGRDCQLFVDMQADSLAVRVIFPVIDDSIISTRTLNTFYWCELASRRWWWSNGAK